ncbi:AAA family ATPase [Kaarinaea lacus]
MYDNYFGLKETPFTIAPDPRFLYMSERHREALAHLVYGFERDGGFVLLTGEVGTGKTTISRCLLEQLPGNSNVAMILNPKVNSQELLASICDELHIEYPEGNTSLKVFTDCINRSLLETNAQGRKTVVIIEEAQNLEMEVLEQLRLLTNLETNQRKLLQIIMIGQPELLELLARPELRQLEQRITARYHLLPLSQKDTIDYVKHRLEVAGLREPVFSYVLLKKIYKYTKGIPRKINLLCDRAMLGAYVQNQRQIDKHILDRAAKEVFGSALETHSRPSLSGVQLGIAFATLILIVLGGYMVYQHQDNFVRLAVNIKSYFGGETAPAMEEASAATRPEALDFLQLLDLQTESASKATAFQALYAQWGEELVDTRNDPCEIAQTKGLNCLTKNGDLQSLQMIDRPAVLRFLAGKDKSAYAALVALDDQSATLMIDGRQLKTTLVELESRWFGDYTVLWRLPPNYNGAIKVGTNGPDVQWLASQLATISGTLSGKESDTIGVVSYDASLIRKVKDFQAQEGLRSDGIAGAQTLIRINTIVGANVPRLSKSFAETSIPDKQSASAIDDRQPERLARVSVSVEK